MHLSHFPPFLALNPVSLLHREKKADKRKRIVAEIVQTEEVRDEIWRGEGKRGNV